jgi:chemotaxis family two-component system response regulator Rcp1
LKPLLRFTEWFMPLHRDIRLMQEAFKDSRLSNNLSVTRNGEQAMAFLLKNGLYANSSRPDLILLDLTLPPKDGREVLAELKKEQSLAGGYTQIV